MAAFGLSEVEHVGGDDESGVEFGAVVTMRTPATRGGQAGCVADASVLVEPRGFEPLTS